MNSSWLPSGLEVFLIAAYFLILASHARHIVTTHSSVRWWHIGHVVMALGMIDMPWPSTMPIGPHAGQAIFALATLVALAGLLIAAIKHREWQLWLISVVDLGAMIYMFELMEHPEKALTVAFVMWHLCEAYAWTTGLGLRLLAGCPHEDDLELRITLIVMALGMAYMFLAMQYGMGNTGMHMPGMTPMGNMPGM